MNKHSSIVLLPPTEREFVRRGLRRPGKNGTPQKPRLRYGPHGARMSVSSGYGYGSVQALDDTAMTAAAGGTADYHARDYTDRMRAESRRFWRENGIYQASIKRIVDCILGDGSTLQVKVGNKRVRQWLEDYWRMWWVDGMPEASCKDDGASVERMVVTQMFVDGDVGIKKIRQGRRRGKFQVIGGERIAYGALTTTRLKNGNVIEQGIEKDRLGLPVRYYVCSHDDWGRLRASDAKAISARDMLFLANRELMDQTRGTPVQQVNFPMFHRIDDVCDSEAAAWQLLSRFAVMVNRKDAAALAEETSEEYDSPDDQDMAKRYHDIGEAVMFHAEPGEELRGVDRNIPGTNFVESIKMFMRLLGLPFGLSLEFMLLIWSDTNYSSGRASKLQVMRACGPWMRKFKREFLSQIWRWKVREAIREYPGHVPPGRTDIFNHEFHFPPYPMLDEQKDEQAITARYENGRTTPSREAKLQGDDFHGDLLPQQEADIMAICEMLERVRKAYPWVQLHVGDVSGFGHQQRVSRKIGGEGDAIPE